MAIAPAFPSLAFITGTQGITSTAFLWSTVAMGHLAYPLVALCWRGRGMHDGYSDARSKSSSEDLFH
jgi:hypothetical protein